MRSSVIVHAAVAGLLLPAALRAQGVGIEHSPVECIAAGKYAKLTACFAPATRLARSRVMFRVEGTTRWYYVEMKTDAPCFTGVLPKPKKSIINKKIEYYVQATDKRFADAQTQSYLPLVVKSVEECKDRPAAVPLNNASVVVLPSVPAGFAVGSALSGTAIAAGVVGAGAATAGGVALAKKDSSSSSSGGTQPTTPPVAPVTTAPPTTTPATTLPPQQTNGPPNAVFKVNPNPPIGLSPLTVSFNMCQSTDPDGDPLQFTFLFGDGSSEKGFCREDHTYTTTTFAAVQKADANFVARNCVTDGIEGHEQCKNFNVVVQPRTPPPTTPTNPCANDTGPPTVRMTGPPSVFPSPQPYPINFTAAATDDTGVAKVKYTARPFYQGPIVDLGESSVPPNYTFSLSQTQAELLLGCNNYGDVFATALDVCGKTSTSAAVTYFIDTSGTCANGLRNTAGPQSTRRLVWTSQLDVPGAQGQVVLNGSAAHFPRAGRAASVAEPRSGENRVEAMLVGAEGKPGLWRFELGEGAFEPGSLRPVAGAVALITESAIAFRLSGKTGERVVFSFRSRR